MGAKAPVSFADWKADRLDYDPDYNVFTWTGGPCPQVGMFIPDNYWGNVVFPRLVGRVYTGQASQDCGGGIAEHGFWTDREGGIFGQAAWDWQPPHLPAPDDDPPAETASGPDYLTWGLLAAAAWVLLK